MANSRTAIIIAPRIEVELAFILGKPLKGPGVTLFDVLNATDYVVPALELIDARIEQLDRVTQAPRKVLDTITQYVHEQGLSARRVGLEELFAPSTMDL